MSNIGQVVFNSETQTFGINFISQHAYIIIVTCLTFIIHFFLGGRVGAARKKYGVKLPHLYETPDEKGETKTPFNNHQRGHMHFVENVAIFLSTLFISGIFYPVFSSVCGLVWLVSRIVYAIGYSNKGPEGRTGGAILAFFSQAALIFSLIYVSYKMITMG